MYGPHLSVVAAMRRRLGYRGSVLHISASALCADPRLQRARLTGPAIPLMTKLRVLTFEYRSPMCCALTVHPKIVVRARFVGDRLRATGLRPETAFACTAQFLFPPLPEVSPVFCVTMALVRDKDGFPQSLVRLTQAG